MVKAMIHSITTFQHIDANDKEAVDTFEDNHYVTDEKIDTIRESYK